MSMSIRKTGNPFSGRTADFPPGIACDSERLDGSDRAAQVATEIRQRPAAVEKDMRSLLTDEKGAAGTA